jgi:hypothetical protein
MAVPLVVRPFRVARRGGGGLRQAADAGTQPNKSLRSVNSSERLNLGRRPVRAGYDVVCASFTA